MGFTICFGLLSILLAAAAFLAAGWLFSGPSGSRVHGVVLLIGGFLFLFLAGVILSDFRTGSVASDTGDTRLTENGIYETICSAKINEEKWAVVIRDQDGKLLSYVLRAEPPKIWKRTVTADGKPQYQPYPGPQ